MAKHRVPYLVKRGEIFYFRTAVPTELRNLFERDELKVSLRTRELRIATLRCRRFTVLFDQLVSKAKSMPPLSSEEVRRLVQSYFHSRLIEANEIVDELSYGPEGERAEAIAETDGEIDRFRKQIAGKKYDDITIRRVRALLEGTQSENLSKVSDEFDALCNGILRAEAELVRVYVAKLMGRYEVTYPKDPLFAGVWTDALPPLPGTSNSASPRTIGALVHEYCDVKTKSVWAAKTEIENRRGLQWFSEIVGVDREISSLSTQDIRDFRDVMIKLPSNASKSGEFDGMSLRDIAINYKGVSNLSISSVRKYFANVRAFLGWAIDEEYLATMPGPNINPPTIKNSQDQRYPFSAQQLQGLFASPLYRGSLSSARRSKPGTIIVRDAHFWIPLIALFSGMRMGEIVQLRSTDIKSDDGVLYFDVVASEEMKLKTESSARRIPVHPQLLGIGLSDFVNQRKSANPDLRLFHEIKKGQNGSYSHNFSKWFSRYLKAVKIKTSKTTFHSFRHNFKDALVEGNVEDSRIMALMGHSDRSVTSKYGSKISVGVLNAEICKINYDLDLSFVSLDSNL